MSLALYLCTRVALPHMKDSGGSVVNIEAVVTRAPRYRFGCVASKGAVEARSRALAGDLGPDGVRVNVVRPGIVPSGSAEPPKCKRSSLFRRWSHVPRPLPTLGTGMEVAAAVAFLISDDSRGSPARFFDVDGLYSLGIPQ